MDKIEIISLVGVLIWANFALCVSIIIKSFSGVLLFSLINILILTAFLVNDKKEIEGGKKIKWDLE